MIICNVVGARPNFMKMAPIMNAQRLRGLSQICVHTGQHYDEKMSQIFFDELHLPRPDLYLGIGSDTHARQTARIMTELEAFFLRSKPDLVVVAGDVNSTLAASLAAAKLNIPIAHIEAGLRSFDRTMPEEINRVVTDHVSDLLFTTEQSGNENLLREGISPEKIHFVGNCMIDSLFSHLENAVARRPWAALNLSEGEYAILTLHRPSNVDQYDTILRLTSLINEVAVNVPIVFPVHPRTRKQIASMSLAFSERVILCEPLSYLSFLGLMAKSRFVITDSGGIQEETTALGVPCLTMRKNTERPCTVALGTNRLISPNGDDLRGSVREILSDAWPKGTMPPLWDGRAAARVVEAIEAWQERGTEMYAKD
jgi:UDP-N-acetylglucosamine 2-epimerase (non-hydrolysing)